MKLALLFGFQADGGGGEAVGIGSGQEVLQPVAITVLPLSCSRLHLKKFMVHCMLLDCAQSQEMVLFSAT
ncbi:hypothetical protein [Leisingera sp. ANG-S]|uniref:hypothetical protein n=1 Tax=Leisingera sp. ANG-S TaxID=1577898 RepID=UPI00126A4934|nr:hypothetical protein [Leisingera sp. ANG-S]